MRRCRPPWRSRCSAPTSAFTPRDFGERLRGYALMHAALALGFLSKSAAAWMVPALDARHAGGLGEAPARAVALGAVSPACAAGCDRFCPGSGGSTPGPTAPVTSRFSSGTIWWADSRRSMRRRRCSMRRRTAIRRASISSSCRCTCGRGRCWSLPPRGAPGGAAMRRPARLAPLRFALASARAAARVLSVAATARNIYLAPALPGLALLLGWWVRGRSSGADRWDLRAPCAARAALLALAVLVFAAALARGRPGCLAAHELAAGAFVPISGLGLAAAAGSRSYAGLCARRGRLLRAPGSAAVRVLRPAGSGPPSQLYRRVDAWQNLASIGGAIERGRGRPTADPVRPRRNHPRVHRHVRAAPRWN